MLYTIYKDVIPYITTISETQWLILYIWIHSGKKESHIVSLTHSQTQECMANISEIKVSSRIFHLVSIQKIKWGAGGYPNIATAGNIIWWIYREEERWRTPIYFSLQCEYVEHKKSTTEPSKIGSCCTLGNIGSEDFLPWKGGLFYHTNWKASLGCAHWMRQDQLPLWSFSSAGNRGKPGHQYSVHTLTACACRDNHFSAPFRFYLLVIFPFGRKGFSSVLSRGTNLTEDIGNCPTGILLGFYWSWSAHTKCDTSFRVFWGDFNPKVSLGWLDFLLLEMQAMLVCNGRSGRPWIWGSFYISH